MGSNKLVGRIKDIYNVYDLYDYHSLVNYITSMLGFSNLENTIPSEMNESKKIIRQQYKRIIKEFDFEGSEYKGKPEYNALLNLESSVEKLGKAIHDHLDSDFPKVIKKMNDVCKYLDRANETKHALGTLQKTLIS